MYKSFKMSNFRCFRELILDDLERVNLIAGKNNVGKTTLLEALFLHCGTYNPELAMRVNAFRGIEMVKIEFGVWTETPWDSLFHQFDNTKTIKLLGKDTMTGERSLQLKVLRKPSELARVVRTFYQRAESPDKTQTTISTSEAAKVLALEYNEKERRQHGTYYLIVDAKEGIHPEPIPPAPPFPTFFQSARLRIPPLKQIAERYGRLVIKRKQDVVLQVLQLIEPRLKSLETVIVADEPILHGNVGLNRLMPLPLMGEGMVRLASLVIDIGNASNGVVLIDEIDNGLHYSVLPKVWRAIGEVAREFDTQVFATTHSLECIVAAHRAFSEKEHYDFRLHRLERTNGTIRAITYDQETLEAAIETGLEVR